MCRLRLPRVENALLQVRQKGPAFLAGGPGAVQSAEFLCEDDAAAIARLWGSTVPQARPVGYGALAALEFLGLP